MCFLKHDVPTCGLSLVDLVDVNEHHFEAADISETVLNRFLLKNWI